MDSHTLIQALIYLGSAALIVPIAVRLGLGSVLGYLIAGCIIGPWGLRLVTDAESILHDCGNCAPRCSAAGRCRWSSAAC